MLKQRSSSRQQLEQTSSKKSIKYSDSKSILRSSHYPLASKGALTASDKDTLDQKQQTPATAKSATALKKSKPFNKTSNTKCKGNSEQKGDWQAILNEVEFLKKKVSQMEVPKSAELSRQYRKSVQPTQAPKYQNRSNEYLSSRDGADTYNKQNVTTCISRLDSRSLLQEVDRLREQILHLRRQNSRKDDALAQSKKQLAYQRREAVKLSTMLEQVRKQNLKLRQDFLKRNKAYFFESQKENNMIYNKHAKRPGEVTASDRYTLYQGEQGGATFNAGLSKSSLRSSVFTKKEPTQNSRSDVNLLSSGYALNDYL